MDCAVVFLDLLGFRNLLRVDGVEATEDVLNNYNTILSSGGVSYQHFTNFLPMSDSIIVTSQNSDILISAVSEFLIHCFLFTAGAYINVKPGSDPTKLTIPEISPTGSRLKQVTWAPTIFRGGCSWGDVQIMKQISIAQNNQSLTANALGIGLLNAIILEEKKVKGPRLLADKNIRGELSVATDSYIYYSEVEQCFEVLWPAFIFNAKNNSMVEVNEFQKLFNPAFELYKFYRDKPHGVHYEELIRLIVRSTLRFFESSNEFQEVKNRIGDIIKQNGLEKEFGPDIQNWGKKMPCFLLLRRRGKLLNVVIKEGLRSVSEFIRRRGV